MGVPFPRIRPVFELSEFRGFLKFPSVNTRLGESAQTLSSVRPRLMSLSFSTLRCESRVQLRR